MKKAFVAILSFVALVACSQDTVVKTSDHAAITFENFVEKKTRAAVDPSTTTESITKFSVWGFRGDAAALILQEELVYKTPEGWIYDNLQYWNEGADYFFAAVSPVDDEQVEVDASGLCKTGLGSITFTNTSAGDVDLIYASQLIDKNNVDAANPQPVKLKFAHLLSKVKFSMAYDFPNDLTTVAVKDIKLANTPAVGTIDLTKERSNWMWTLPQTGETVTMEFGDIEGGEQFPTVNDYYESDVECLLIPADATRSYTITFTIEVYNNGVLSAEYPKTVTLTNRAFVQGKSYNLKTLITPDNIVEGGLKPIEFEVVEVEAWDAYTDVDLDGEQTEEPVEPTVLATPVVESSVDVNVVTLTWNEVEGAAYYTVQVDDDIAEQVEGTTYVFEGDYEMEYMFTVVAVPAEGENLVASEAAVVKAITEAEPQEPETPSAIVATVAEFLAAAEDTQMYQLTGVITRMYRENNSNDTLYGNFYLKDATGEVLIYGLYNADGEQYWTASGAKIGDTITVQTVRTSYSGSPQGKNATFIELVPFVEAASEWGVVGDFTNWGGSPDVVMYNTWKGDNLFVAYDVEIASGAFKIRANNAWNDTKNYGLEVAGSIYADKYYSVVNGGGSQNATPIAYGTYDVYFDLANSRIALMTPGKEYAAAEDGGNPVVVVAGLTDHEWGLVGSFNGWDVANYVVTEVQGDWAVAKNVTLENGAEFKFAADKDWALSYGVGGDVNVGETYVTYNNGGNMKFVGEAGAYNLYFSLVDASFYMEAYSAARTVVFDVANYGFANQAALSTYEVDGVTFAFAGGGNQNNPKYYTSGSAVRCYPKNTITISGATIKSAKLVVPTGYTNAIDLYHGSNKLDNFTWEGSEDTLVLTFDPSKTSGQSRFIKIEVVCE